MPDRQPFLRQIKASAGSGKTYELTRRFLLQLESASDKPLSSIRTPSTAEAAAWGEIIAVTFTNAAAAEMKHRVILTLKTLALGGVGPHGVHLSREPAKIWVDRILRHYSALNIRTIDSLLHMVTRAAALKLGLPPEFEPVFATEEAFAPILDALMEEAARHANAQPADLHDTANEATDASNYALLDAVCHSLVYDHDSKGFLLGDKLLNTLSPLLNGALLGQYDTISPRKDLEATLMGWQESLVRAAQDLQTCTTEQKLLWQKNAAVWLENISTAIPGPHATWWQNALKKYSWWQKACLTDCLLKKSPTPDTSAEKTFATLCAAAATLHGSGTLVRNGLKQLDFVKLAKALVARFTTVVQAEQKLPALLIPYLADRVLEESVASETLCRMGSRLTFFLIDEFQDTSTVQWNALEPLALDALSRGGGLTWVGDVKQAIYGWRGGDAALFDTIATTPALVHVAGAPLRESLSINWRSRAAVIETNNALFSLLEDARHVENIVAKCLPKDAPQALLDVNGSTVTAITNAFAAAAQQLSPKEGMDGGMVSIRALTCDAMGRAQSDSAAAQEKTPAQQRDAARREVLLEVVHEVAQRRPWGDVAILTRSNGNAAAVAAWLMEAHIPVVTENSLLLTEHPLIKQTVAFLRFLDNQSDDVACHTCMSGTLVTTLPELRDEGFSRQALADLAAQRTNRQPLHQLVRHYFPRGWTRVFAPFFLQAGLMSPYDMVQEWFTRLDVAQRFPQDAAFLRRFLEVVHAAEAQGHATLPAFLTQWDEHGADEKVPLPEGMDAVRVITIHKAKGLEFPVVILPWMDFSIAPKNEHVLVQQQGLTFLTRCCKDMGMPYYEALSQSLQEDLHLLYVAWTRARDELHCFHFTAASSKGSQKNLTPALDYLLEQAGMTPPYTKGKPTQCTPHAHPALPLPTHAPTADLLDAASWTADAMPPVTAKNTLESAVSSGNAVPPVATATTPNIAAYVEDRPQSAAPTKQDVWQGWRPMGWLPRLKVFRNPLGALVTAASEEKLGALRGTLMHAALEHIRLTGQPEEDARAAVHHALRTAPTPVPDTQHLEESLMRGVVWFAGLPDALLWKQYGVPEQSLLDQQDKEYRVDLLVETVEGFLALEFKTGAPHEEHITQTRHYVHLLTALDGRDARGLILYLDRGCCRAVTEHGHSDLLPTPQACGIVCHIPGLTA